MAAFPLPHRTVRLVAALALALVLLPVPGAVARGPGAVDPPGASGSRPDAAKPFRLNLARRSDYVAQANFVQCVGASVQMMLNIIEPGADRTRRTQRELQDLARAWSGPRPDGRVRQGAGVSGWAAALTINRAGPYRVVGADTLDEAMRIAATAIREYRKPVGLLVWQGRHAWVMSGFEATGDPVDGTLPGHQGLHPGSALPARLGRVGAQPEARDGDPGLAGGRAVRAAAQPRQRQPLEPPPRHGPPRRQVRARGALGPDPPGPRLRASGPTPRGTAALVQWPRVRLLLPNPGATHDRSSSMKTTRALAELGQSLWLDNITRPLLDSGTLARYIDELDVTGLTSNPTIYDRAIGGTDAYDAEIAEAAHAGKSGEDTFFEVALSDLRRAADLFRPVHDRTDGVDGFVSPRGLAAPRLRRRRPPSPRRSASTRRATGRTCSSRSRARPRACRPSRRRSPPGCRST